MSDVSLADLPDLQAVLSKAGNENFPVALRLLPRRQRESLLAIYCYARLVDDVGDELAGDPARRLLALDAVEAELQRALAGRATHPVFVRLGEAASRCGFESSLLADLIEANRLDQRRHSYETFSDLLEYCRLSAHPVGRLTLAVFGESDEENAALSDLVCSGLQLVEHFQDVAEDAARGRVYLPQEDLRTFGVPESALTKESGEETPDTFRRLMAFEVTRARTMLGAGSRLVDRLATRQAALAVAGFAGGGLAQLAAIERAGYDVLAHQVKARPTDVAREATRLLRQRGGKRRAAGLPVGKAA